MKFQISIILLLSINLLHGLEVSPIVTEKDEAYSVINETGMELPILGIPIDMSGKINLSGKIDVETGTASLVMWTRVEGKMYFTKVADLQSMKIEKDKTFSIQFDAGDKKADYLVLVVGNSSPGRCVVKELQVK